MKKAFSCLLLAALVFSCFPIFALANSGNLPGGELDSAKLYGLPTEKIDQPSVSGAEMAEILDALLEYAAPERLSAWQGRLPVIRASEAPLSRFDAMAFWYLAAQEAGGDYLGHQQNVMSLVRSMAFDWEINLQWELFAGEDLPDSFDCGEIGRGDLDAACYYYNLSRVSFASGEHPFSIDRESNAIPFDRALTYEEALLAVVRLIDSTRYAAPSTAADDACLAVGEKRREEIRQAKTEPDVTGTVYYVAGDGDDANDGLSPETAWATPLHAVNAGLRPGDAVLFRRGDTWYVPSTGINGESIVALELEEGIAAGAYGSGAKPILRGDVPEACEPGFWQLYSDRDGARIWKAAEALRDVPVIVFDGGERYACAVRPWLDEQENYIHPDGSAFAPEEALYKDLTFCSLLDMNEAARGDSPTGHAYALMTGALYLRCDAGNPAEVFDEIAVPQLNSAFSLHPDASISDLDLRYFTMTGTGVTSRYDTTWGQTFSNLEISWCGGFLMEYGSVEPAGMFLGWRPTLGGGGLTAMAGNCVVENCYIHDCGPFSIIISIHANSPEPVRASYEAIHITGNLIEDSATALHMGGYAAVDVPGSESYVSQIVFEDNVLINTGKCWLGETRNIGGITYSVLENRQGAINTDGIYIRNNLFYNRGVYPTFSLTDYVIDADIPANQRLVFENNTYAQMGAIPLLLKNEEIERYFPTEEVVRSKLMDETAELVILD